MRRRKMPYLRMPGMKKSPAALLIALISAGLIYVASDRVKVPVDNPVDKGDYSDILAAKVIDGDTIALENGERVRLIGIDTPESRINEKLKLDARRSGRDYAAITAMGKKAAKFTRQLVENKPVRLEFDVTKTDKYGRLLAYVFLSDGTFVNAEIVKQGYADPMTIPPNVKYAGLFHDLYVEARAQNRGLWKNGE
jgi:micrococcal nuclease